MRQNKWKNRDKMLHKKKHGMVVSNKSIFTLVKVWTGKRKRKKKWKFIITNCIEDYDFIIVSNYNCCGNNI